MKVTEITGEGRSAGAAVVQRTALSPVAPGRIPDSVAVRERPAPESAHPGRSPRGIHVRGLASLGRTLSETAAHLRRGHTAGVTGRDTHTDGSRGASDQPPGGIPPEGPVLPRGPEPERWENPRGVKLMAPVARLEDIEIDEISIPEEARAVRAMQTVVREAQAAGIEIIDTVGMRPEKRVPLAQTAENFDIMPHPALSITRELELAEKLSRRGELNVPSMQYLPDMSRDDMREMLEEEGAFMLLRIDLDRGEGKYLIDRPDQVETLARLLDDEDTRPLLERLVVRQFIPSPTDHYTSLKVYTNPRAEAIAATLLYSHHTKEESRHPVIAMPDPRRSYDPARILLEDPASDGYLRAKDGISLSKGGFGQIALMGQFVGRLQPGEAEILEAHGISAKYPAVPAEILEQVGRLQPLARLAGLVSSSDFVINAYTMDPFYLETNTAPGPSPVAVCLLGDPAHPDRFEAMYRNAVRSLL